MSTPTGPQDPSAEPNPYGQQPPAYGQQPPAYGQQPGYGMAPGYPAAPGYYAPSGTEQNNLGVWAVSLGIAGFVCLGILGAIPAIILGMKAKAAAAEGRANNPGLGTAGIVLGWIEVVLTIVSFVVLAIVISSVGWEEFVDSWSSSTSYR